MKKKTKIFIAMIIGLVLLVPVPTRYKDGGTVRYRSVFYDITKYHQLDLEAETGYHDGWKIKVLGFPIFDNFN